MRIGRILLILLALFAGLGLQAEETESSLEARAVLSDLILETGDTDETLTELAKFGDEIIEEVVEAWRIGRVSVIGSDPDAKVLIKRGDDYTELLTGEPFEGDTSEAKVTRAGRSLRRDLSRLVDVIELASPDLDKRAEAAIKLGAGQNPDYLPELEARLPNQENARTKRAFQQAIHLSKLANGSPAEKIAAVQWLGENNSVASRDFIKALVVFTKEDESAEADLIRKEAIAALESIAAYENRVENLGTLFRGLSSGSVLLIVAYGLAITFGLMGVINMAHGEFIAIGAYTVYVVQNWFADRYGVGNPGYDTYFIVAIPLAFLVAAFFGALLERGVIRFLYKRPLESLLATWGVSLIIQQLLRMQFGAANVQVSSPEWLSGGFVAAGVTITYNRLFVIFFAGVVVFITWFLLRRTPMGLQIRATMQNRAMASSLGIASTRVNVLTFAFGSGLAGLAGAFLSQLGNVGPEMGGDYIVDSFMVVVIGGVGNLMGAAVSSLGIGMIDQGLQPVLGPVMGKICVLFAIILFLQWRPGGLFPSRSRSLDD